MKAVVSKADLVSIISKIQNIISSKPAIPVLANVLIESIDNQLILSATDLTTSMKCYTEAKVIEEGSIALPAKKFFQLVRELTSPQVKITKYGNEIAEIVSGSSIFKINGMQKSEFPTIPDPTGTAQISFLCSNLKEMFYRSVFSAARDDSRYVLNGVNLSIYNSAATFVATDGKRLAKLKTDVALDQSFIGTYILPLKSVEEMIKTLDESSERATLSLMPDKVFLETGNVLLSTKLLSGQYPDIEKVIPQISSKPIVLHKDELISLLKQVSLFISDISSSVRFIFTNGQLSLSANSSNIGEGLVSMPVDYTGEKLEIAFNPFFFIDILRHSSDEVVNFAITDSYNPGVITDSSEAIYVIMPMRLPENATNPISTEEMNDPKNPAFA